MALFPVFTIRYIISLVFGIIVTAAFAELLNRKNALKLFAVFSFILAIELYLIATVSLDFTLSTYPIHTHFVLILFLIFLFKIRWYDSVIYTLLAYMCCQIPAWISKFIEYILPGNATMECVLYLIIALLSAYYICRYVEDSVKAMLGISLATDLAFGIIPITYYLFDYITTVWTSLLYEGNYHITQFMPFIVCIAYLIFLVVLRKEQKQKTEVFEERTIIEHQLALVKSEIEQLHELEQMSRIYRHDMRHHFVLILQFIEEDRLSDAVSYINDNIKEIEKITPQKFCDMDVLNLLLSHFASTAEKDTIHYSFDVRLPQNIPLNNIEMCTLVSNALENAYNEVMHLPTDQRSVDMVFCEYKGLLIFSVDNSCEENTVVNGINTKPAHTGEHGLGTRSIAAIAKKHRGTVDFQVKEGIFKLMVTIPLAK